MRVFARISLTVALGLLATAAPSTAQAQSQPALAKPWYQPFHRHKKADKSVAKATHLCNDCQRALVKKRDGVDIPPVPPMPAGMMVDTGPCSKCKKPVLVVREEKAPATSVFEAKLMNPRMPRGRGDAPVGVAVATDEPVPGQSVLVSAEPFPVGVYQQRVAAAAPAGAPGMPGSRDSSVMPTNGTMPASDPIGGPGHNRPHIISHLFGLSAIGRERAEERERRDKETHAAVRFNDQVQSVNELPAKMVYGK